MNSSDQSYWHRKAYFAAWLLWALLLAFVIGYTATHLGKRTVTPSYWNAAKAWVEGRELYDGTGRGFIYFPQSAILQIPFAFLPFGAAEILWRLINIGLLSLSCCVSSGFFKNKNRDQVFLIITLITIPLAFSSARNGQANLLIISLMLLMIHFMLKDCWWTAVSISAIGLCIKPFMIVPISLFSGIFPRKFLLRSIPMLVLVAALPYLTQRPEYATGQIQACIQSLKATAEIGRSVEYAYIFSMLRVWGFDFFNTTESLLTLLAALFFYVYCLLIARNSQKLGIITAMGASAVFILLFNSRTEHNTYVLIAPFLAIFASKTWNTSLIAPIVWRAMLICSFILILSFSGHDIWSAPLGTLMISTLAFFAVLKRALGDMEPRDTV